MAGALIPIAPSAVRAAIHRELLVYLALILGWALPVRALQWAWGPGVFVGARRIMITAVAVPTLYLWLIDRIAFGLGLWDISERYSTGLDPFGLPVEEAVFFLGTSSMVVQGQVALLWLRGHRRASPVSGPMPAGAPTI